MVLDHPIYWQLRMLQLPTRATHLLHLNYDILHKIDHQNVEAFNEIYLDMQTLYESSHAAPLEEAPLLDHELLECIN